MIKIPEQYGFERTGFYEGLSDKQIESLSNFKESGCARYVSRKRGKEFCFCIDFDKEYDKFHFQTSYFTGVDWIEENSLSINVRPKLNNQYREVNYIRMLLEALQEPANSDHLEDLVHIDFEKPYIRIDRKEDMLSPFLIAQFLQVVKRIARKGLKKSYYTKTENLNARIKGKILTARNIKENLLKGKQIDTICRFQEFGINSDENKILKKACLFSLRAVNQYEKGFDIRPLRQLLNYILPAFEQVSDKIDIDKIKTYKTNPLFKEYDVAIRLALLILRRYSYNITQTEQQEIPTPPFWIDMSKLFELYVFKKLRNIFPVEDVKYHFKTRNQELDFVLKLPDKDSFFVVDTKYKPRYHNHNINVEDIRQVCGYARLKKVYEELSLSDYNRNIDCLVIYSHQDCDETLEPKHFEFDENNDIKRIRKEPGYVNFYKLGIKLPEL